MDMALLAVLAILAVSGCVVWLVVTILSQAWPASRRWPKVLLAGLTPTLIIIALLSAWHVWARIEYENAPQEGFMSPLLILLYGFPYALLNLAVNFGVALRVSRAR